MFKKGDLVWVNKFSPSFTSHLLADTPIRQQTLFKEYSLLGVVMEVYPDICYVYTTETEKYKYIYKEDIIKCQD
jgi:hypothetical protein